MSQLLERLLTAARSAGVSTAGASVLSARRGSMVVRAGDVVAKAHRPDTDVAALTWRLSVARSGELAEVFVPPLCAEPARLEDGTLVTFWPAGRPVDADPPWTEAGRLLAALHAANPPPSRSLPPCGAEARLFRAVMRLEDTDGSGREAADDIAAVRAAATAVSAAVRDLAVRSPRKGRPVLVHGDFHLGQLVRSASAGADAWRLIDIDDLGIGDPAWDLARTASFFAVGLLPAGAWHAFASGYRESGGEAFRSSGQVWEAVDLHARALTVQCAATAIARSHEAGRVLDDSERVLVEGCRRIARA